MFTPLIFVFIFARGMLAQHPSYLLAGSVGYALLGPARPRSTTSSAPTAPGIQLYLLAPVRLRDVIVAKNLASLALLLVEAVLTWCLVIGAGHRADSALVRSSPPSFWIVFMLFTNLALGTLRSIQAPRKIAIAQARRVRNSLGQQDQRPAGARHPPGQHAAAGPGHATLRATSTIPGWRAHLRAARRRRGRSLRAAARKRRPAHPHPPRPVRPGTLRRLSAIQAQTCSLHYAVLDQTERNALEFQQADITEG